MSIIDFIKKLLGLGSSSPSLKNYQWDAAKLCIAGVDRDWLQLKPSEVCDLAVKTGCNAISIEMVANDNTNFNSQAEKYPEYLKETRKRKLVMFVCIVNDWVNANYYKGSAQKMRDIVIKSGSEGVIAQPVGETHTSQGAAFEKETVRMLKEKGFKTCCNNDGGRPNSKDGMDYAAWHSSGVNANTNCPKGFIEITDHGQKIDWIGYFNADRVQQIAQNAKNRGAGFGLYRYVGMGNHGSPKSMPVSASKDSWTRMGKIYK
jgi:hypothetical protein